MPRKILVFLLILAAIGFLLELFLNTSLPATLRSYVKSIRSPDPSESIRTETLESIHTFIQEVRELDGSAKKNLVLARFGQTIRVTGIPYGGAFVEGANITSSKPKSIPRYSDDSLIITCRTPSMKPFWDYLELLKHLDKYGAPHPEKALSFDVIGTVKEVQEQLRSHTDGWQRVVQYGQFDDTIVFEPCRIEQIIGADGQPTSFEKLSKQAHANLNARFQHLMKVGQKPQPSSN